METDGANQAISFASRDAAPASAQTIASVRRDARAASASCESASESAVSGSGASFSRWPGSGNARTSAGSAASGIAVGLGAAAGSRMGEKGAEAAVAASVEAVGMRRAQKTSAVLRELYAAVRPRPGLIIAPPRQFDSSAVPERNGHAFDVAPHVNASPYLLLTLAPFFWSCNWIVG